MAFRDLTDVLGASSPKVLPINGKMVEFPARISAWAGTALISIRRAAQERTEQDADTIGTALLADGTLSEDDAIRLESEVLGDGAAVLDDLGVLGEAREHIVGTLIVWHLSGEQAAERAWEGAPGKAPAPSRATRRRTAGRTSKTGGGAAASSRTAAGASSGRRSPRGSTSKG